MLTHVSLARINVLKSTHRLAVPGIGERSNTHIRRLTFYTLTGKGSQESDPEMHR